METKDQGKAALRLPLNSVGLKQKTPLRRGFLSAEQIALFTGIEIHPAIGSQLFQWAIASFVLHARGIFDPIAEIDEGQASIACAQNMVHDDEVTKASPALSFGIIKAVDHRQPVGLDIGDARANKFALRAIAGGEAIFDYMAADRRLFDHVGIIHVVHVSHAALGVALLQIAAKQFELFVGRPWAASRDDEVGIAAQDLALRRVRLEFVGKDADRDASLAVHTARPIGNVLAAAKTDAAQRFVEFAGMRAAEFGEYLSLGFSGQIGAGRRICNEEARKTDWCAHENPTLLNFVLSQGYAAFMRC